MEESCTDSKCFSALQQSGTEQGLPNKSQVAGLERIIKLAEQPDFSGQIRSYKKVEKKVTLLSLGL